jgi:capsular exopolysaccharide synthesis family protein
MENLELRWYLQVLRRWLWLIVGCTLLGATSAFLVSSWIPPVYRASTSLLVRVGGTADDGYTAILASEHLAATYQELLTRRPVIEAVAQTLGLDPRQTEEKIQVDLIPQTSVIRLTVEDNDPRLAVEIANGVVAAFMRIARDSGTVQSRDIVVVEPASMRMVEEPVRPRKLRNTALGAVVGALLAGGLVFLFEYLDDTIHTPDDASRMLGLDTLAAIGRLAKGEEELVGVTHPHSPVAEAFRILYTNIRFSSPDSPLRTILVTSPGVTEGKSITVANLAAAMAQAGLSVVVVDADLRHPRLHQLFGLDLHAEEGVGDQRGWGLSGSLLAGCTDGRLHPTQIEGLQVLPSGELPPNPAGLLGSRRMEELLDQLTHQVDVVLIDSPPVLPVADAALLAHRVDGVLLVLKASHTPRKAARQAVESLRQVGANLVGVVLNAVPTSRGRYYYGYYEYHQDRNAGRKRRPRQRKSLPAVAQQQSGRGGKAN